MARQFQKDFYNSVAWKITRELYFKKAGGLCELCLKQGIYRPGEIVHHKEHITADNVNDPEITLDFNNLVLVCRECHAKLHDRRKRRYKLDELGRVIF